jgi:recombination protein RecA
MTINDAVLAQLKKEVGIEPATYDQVERIPSGSLVFDYVLGGGWPRNRMALIYGEESSGKTTSALLAAQYVLAHPDEMHNGGVVAWFDTEGAYDPMWAQRLGISDGANERMVLFQPENGEAVQQAVRVLVQHKVCDLIVIDSIAETAFSEELEGSMDDNFVGVGARKWNRFYKVMKSDLVDSGTAILLINQIRHNIGVFMGSPETVPGGRGEKFATSIRVRMSKPDYLTISLPDGGKLDSIVFKPKTVKNKTAKPNRQEGVELLVGLDRPMVLLASEIATMGKILGVFTNKAGDPIVNGIWHLNGVPIANGKANVVAKLMEDTVLHDAAEKAVREAIAQLNTLSEGEDGDERGNQEPDTGDDPAPVRGQNTDH